MGRSTGRKFAGGKSPALQRRRDCIAAGAAAVNGAWHESQGRDEANSRNFKTKMARLFEPAQHRRAVPLANVP